MHVCPTFFSQLTELLTAHTSLSESVVLWDSGIHMLAPYHIDINLFVATE